MQWWQVILADVLLLYAAVGWLVVWGLRRAGALVMDGRRQREPGVAVAGVRRRNGAAVKRD
jgi:hypothetical protein